MKYFLGLKNKTKQKKLLFTCTSKVLDPEKIEISYKPNHNTTTMVVPKILWHKKSGSA